MINSQNLAHADADADRKKACQGSEEEGFVFDVWYCKYKLTCFPAPQDAPNTGEGQEYLDPKDHG